MYADVGYFAKAGSRKTAALVDDVGDGAASYRPARVGDNAVGAKLVAAVLDFDLCAGAVRARADAQLFKIVRARN